MQAPNQDTIQKNIFLAIEQYFAMPSISGAEQIKNLSHNLTNEAYEAAKLRFPGKKIGADEYAPILMDNITQQAQEAFSYSARLVHNDHVTQHDPAYIFHVNAEEQQFINKTLIAELLSDGQRHPEGLIFAYDGYIERKASSAWSYCNAQTHAIYKNNALLYAKAAELFNRGQVEAATILVDTCTQIKVICNEHPQLSAKEDIGKIAEILKTASQHEAMKDHQGMKAFLVNFLMTLSGVGLIYLASTTQSRGTFWYHPNTDRENRIQEFTTDIQASPGL